MNMRCLPLDFKSMDQLPKMLDILKIPAIIATPSMGGRLMGLAVKGDEISTQSRMCDVVIKQADGWQAHNLIWKPALRALEAAIGRKSAEDRPLDRKNAIILGSGGLAISLIHGVKKRNGLVSIAAGDEVEAQKIAQQSDIRYVPSAKMYETLVDVVVVTVPNMDYGTKKSPINPSMLRAGMTLMDLSALPDESPLNGEGRMRGCKVVEPSEVFADYIGSLFKSLTGQDLPPEAFAVGLSE
jgi:3-dehydroquinate dehydratase/shikimate dehydrogenase